MALVVSSTPLGGLWARAETATRDERRPLERAPSSSSSSRRLSNESSSPDTLGSSESTSFSTNASAGSKKKAKTKRARRNEPDVVLHVQDCAFALHRRVLKRKCRVLFNFVETLRVQNAIGHLGKEIDENEPILLRVITTPLPDRVLFGDDEDNEHELRDKQFSLRVRDPLTTPRHHTAGTPTHRMGRCPLQPRQQLSDRASPSGSPKSIRFSKVCCIAHQRAEATSHEVEEQRPRSAAEKQFTQEEFSPGKENYVGTLATSSTVRAQSFSRVALAPKMPFSGVVSSGLAPSQRGQLATNARAPSPTLLARSLTGGCHVVEDAFAVELVGASADAVATLVEFLYSGRTSGLHESNATVVTSLCKWFCMEGQLLYAAISVRAQALDSVDQWMDILLCCSNLRCETKKRTVIDYLLYRLMKVPPQEYATAIDQMPLHRLSAIEDADTLARVMLCMVNHLRRQEIWQKLTFALELWLFWNYRRPFVGQSIDGQQSAYSPRQPMSLLDFHQQFVSWNPIIRVEDLEVSGIDAYVTATTLFSFGPFVFQVRFEPKRRPLILWRVVRAGTPADGDDETERRQFRPGMEPPFTVRGTVSIVYKLSSAGPLHRDEVPVRYTHSEKVYGEWQVLLAAPSVQTRQSFPEPESEEKTQDPGSSEEATEPLEGQVHIDNARSTAPTAATTAISTTAGAPGDSNSGDETSPFEPMTSHFSGQFFVWGHRLCNMYHFLLVSTLFYQCPADASHELRREVTLARMRELPVDTLLFVLQSDRLRVPNGETTLAIVLSALCFSDYGTMNFTLEQMHALFSCVRWCYVDLEQIMLTLEHSQRELQLYELVEQQLRFHYNRGSTGRRSPWGVDNRETPYRATTTLIEFQIEAGDRSLSPSKFLFSQELH